jgi:7-carboxy-7-deazaguanine synthase
MRYELAKLLHRGRSIVLISETFAPTIQGEGTHAGERVGFIRLANCNLACTWCDTKYSWDWQHYDKKIETKEWADFAVTSLLREWRKEEHIQRVIITGGEPLMQQLSIFDTLTSFNDVNTATVGDRNMKFDVETNGTIVPHPELIELIDMFVVSPKLEHSGDIEKKRLKADALHTFSTLARQGKTIFKFVITNETDIKQVLDIKDTYDIPSDKIWLMPEGTTEEAIVEGIKWLALLAIKYGFNLSPRLHTIIWGQKRGV